MMTTWYLLYIFCDFKNQPICKYASETKITVQSKEECINRAKEVWSAYNYPNVMHDTLHTSCWENPYKKGRGIAIQCNQFRCSTY